jgi:5-methylcytosine-specific restriction endonuclease McrA
MEQLRDAFGREGQRSTENRSATGYQPMDRGAPRIDWSGSRRVAREANLAEYARVNRHKRGKEIPLPLSKRVLKVAARDGWTCHLCGESIDPKLLVGDGRATIDHLLPRSLGGTARLSNVKLAHKRCNTKRGNQPLENAA